MKKSTLSLIFSCAILFSTLTAFSQTPAFPGAEGHGRYTTGGRGGEIYYVTTLDDNGLLGSLRYALENVAMNKPRTILFKVSGIIYLNSSLTIQYGNVTIAGQSAPGDGICLANYSVTNDADNVIVRFMRFRVGDKGVGVADGTDAFGGRYRKNIIIDHCTMSWSTDECVSFYRNENFTLQWCLLSESMRLSGHTKGPHGYGGIWGGKYASYHHNLLAHHDSRNPRLGGANSLTTDYVDLRNNVIYNWTGNACYGAEGMNVNVVNCYYKLGPGSPLGSNKTSGKIISIDKLTTASTGRDSILNKWGKFFIEGNVVDGAITTYPAQATADNWTYGVYNQFASGYGTVSQAAKDSMRVNTAFTTGFVTTHTAAKAFDQVLLYAGCSHKRDTVDKRIVNEAKTRTAAFHGLSVYNGQGVVDNGDGTTTDWKSTAYWKWGIIDSQDDLKPVGAAANWTAWPNIALQNPATDTDLDGMPDDWEISQGLNPNVTDGSVYTLSNDYTNVELYLNSLVDIIVSKQNENAISTSITQNKKENTVNAFYAENEIHFDNRDMLIQARVLNISGQLVSSLQKDEDKLNVAALLTGCYLVYMQDISGVSKTIKIIK